MLSIERHLYEHMYNQYTVTSRFVTVLIAVVCAADFVLESATEKVYHINTLHTTVRASDIARAT